MNECFVVEAVRTPIGKLRGALKDVRPDDLAALVIRAVVERTKLDAASIDSFITSPSFPVVFIRPLPGSFSASICSRSPPTDVQARPVTTPT